MSSPKAKSQTTEKLLKKQSNKANCKAFYAGALMMFYASFFIVCGVGDIIYVQKTYPYVKFFRLLWAFLVHDIVVITMGSILGIFYLFYLFLGQFNSRQCSFFQNTLKIGRRTNLHMIYSAFFCAFVIVVTNFLCFFHLDYTTDNFDVDGLVIFLGINWKEASISLWFRLAYNVFSYILLFFYFLAYWVDFCRSDTISYLSNMKNVNNAYNFVDEQRRLCPSFWYSVSCYHNEQRKRTRTVSYKDNDGNTQHRTEVYYETVLVETWSGSKAWKYSSCSDISGNFYIDAENTKKNFLRLRLEKAIVFEDKETEEDYIERGKFFKVQNSWRDEYCTLTYHKELKGFQKRVLCNLKGKKPFFVDFSCYAFSTFFAMQLFYRYLLDSVCATQYFLIKKVVSIHPEINIKELDQNTKVDEIIIPIFGNNGNNVITVKNPKNTELPSEVSPENCDQQFTPNSSIGISVMDEMNYGSIQENGDNTLKNHLLSKKSRKKQEKISEKQKI